MQDMDYTCHCGARLQSSSKENKWICPNGHDVYTCKRCEALGKTTPLEWIPQYQRWYCRECEQYAPLSGSTKGSNEMSEEELEELIEGESEEEIEPGNYTLGFTQGSRVYAVCFMCRNLLFTENNTHLRCAANMFAEPAISQVTIRPADAPKCKMCAYPPVCLELKQIPVNDIYTLQKWAEYMEKQVQKQIVSHEKDVAPIEMYRIEFVDTNPAVEGAKATPCPVKRESVLEGRVLVTIDKPNKKVWAYAGVKEPGRFFTGFLHGPSARLFAGIEDPFSPRYLRDLLKRDIESFAVEKVWLGKEPQEFWEVIDKGATEKIDETSKEVAGEPVLSGPRLEMYEMKYHMGRAYGEYYTGGKSDDQTKAITIEPLKTSAEELQPKRAIVVVDHQTRIVWFWVGSKSGRIMKFFVKTSAKKARSIIESRIGRNLENYEYLAVEEGKEPEQFMNLLGK